MARRNFLRLGDLDSQDDTLEIEYDDVNWGRSRNIVLNGVEDDQDIENESTVVFHTIKDESGLAEEYAALAGTLVKEVEVDVFDNDTAGISVQMPIDSEINIDEGDLSVVDSYEITLNSQPSAEVVVTVDPNSHQWIRTARDSDFRANHAPADLIFTPSNWNRPQTVSVRANDDNTVEGLHGGQIIHTLRSLDQEYSGLPPQNVRTEIVDDDEPGIVVLSRDGYGERERRRVRVQRAFERTAN